MSKSLIATTKHLLVVGGMSLAMAFITPGLIDAQNSGGNIDRAREARQSLVRAMPPGRARDIWDIRRRFRRGRKSSINDRPVSAGVPSVQPQRDAEFQPQIRKKQE